MISNDTILICAVLCFLFGILGILLIKLTGLIIKEQQRITDITYDYYESNLELMHVIIRDALINSKLEDL